MDLAFCPDERPRGFIVAGDECVDVGDEFWNALEGRAVERFAGQDREPDFNLVEPGGMCRGVMKPHVSVSLQPHVAFGLMGGEIIEDDMDFTRWMSGDDMVHEVQKLDAPSPFIVLADDCPAGEIECREERRRSMPFVVVRLPRHGAPVRKFQVTLRAFERLDRGLFSRSSYSTAKAASSRLCFAPPNDRAATRSAPSCAACCGRFGPTGPTPRSCCAATAIIAVPKFSTGVGPTVSITSWASRRPRHCAGISKASRPARRRASRPRRRTPSYADSRNSSTAPRAGAASSESSPSATAARARVT